MAVLVGWIEEMGPVIIVLVVLAIIFAPMWLDILFGILGFTLEVLILAIEFLMIVLEGIFCVLALLVAAPVALFALLCSGRKNAERKRRLATEKAGQL